MHRRREVLSPREVSTNEKLEVFCKQVVNLLWRVWQRSAESVVKKKMQSIFKRYHEITRELPVVRCRKAHPDWKIWETLSNSASIVSSFPTFDVWNTIENIVQYRCHRNIIGYCSAVVPSSLWTPQESSVGPLWSFPLFNFFHPETEARAHQNV